MMLPPQTACEPQAGQQPTRGATGMMSDTIALEDGFHRGLRRMSAAVRIVGQNECRLAAIRMLMSAGMIPAARAVAQMNIEAHLTVVEIADRERLPCPPKGSNGQKAPT